VYSWLQRLRAAKLLVSTGQGPAIRYATPSSTIAAPSPPRAARGSRARDVKAASVDSADLEPPLLDVLRRSPDGLRIGAIASALKTSHGPLREAIERLRRAKKVQVTGVRAQTRYHAVATDTAGPTAQPA